MNSLPFVDFSFLFPQLPCSAQTFPCAYPASYLLLAATPYASALFLTLYLFFGLWGVNLFLQQKKLPLALRALSLIGYAFFLLHYPALPYFIFLTTFPLLLLLFFRLPKSFVSAICFTLLLSLLSIGSGFTAFWGTSLFFLIASALTSGNAFKRVLLSFLIAFGIAAIRFLPEAFFFSRHLSFFPPPFPSLIFARLYLYFFPSALLLPFLWGFSYLLLSRQLPLFSPLLIALALLLLLLGNIPFPATPLLRAASAAPFPLDLTFFFLLIESLLFLYGCWGIHLAIASPSRLPATRTLFFILFTIPFLSLTRKFALTRDFYFFDDVFAQGIFFTHIHFDYYVVLLFLLSLIFISFRRLTIPALFLFLSLQFFLFPPKTNLSRTSLLLRYQNKHYHIQAKNIFLPKFLSPYLHSPSRTFYRNLGFQSVISTDSLPLPKINTQLLEAGNLYRLPEPLHFPFVASEVLKVQKEEIVGALSTDFFPVRQKLLASHYRSERRGAGRIIYLERNSETLRLKLICPKGCYLHTGLPFDRGFKLTPSFPTLPINLGFLGVAIPKGKHTLTIRYLPPLLPTGFSLSLFFTLFIPIVLLKKQLIDDRQVNE